MFEVKFTVFWDLNLAAWHIFIGASEKYPTSFFRVKDYVPSNHQ
jgi:hypothetical protein